MEVEADVMSKRVRGPVELVRHADLQGAALPRDDAQAVSVRLSGWYLQLWKQLCDELPGLTPSDLVRRSLLVTGATIFENEEGGRPDVFIRDPHSGVETRLDAYLGLDGQGLIKQASPVDRVVHSDLRGAAKPREESYAISVRVFGFYRQLYEQIVDELDGLSPSDVIRRCLLVLAATVFKDADGKKAEVYIRNPGAEAERLDAFLGLDA